MAKKGHNPFRGFVDSISETNRMREHWMTGEGTQEDQRRTHATAWVPTTDIFARDGDLVIRAELAGVAEQDIEISVSGGMLTISGERKNDTREEDIAGYYVRERFYGNFRRTMTLPEGVDENDIAASFENGMLEIAIKGGTTAKPRRIQIGS